MIKNKLINEVIKYEFCKYRFTEKNNKLDMKLAMNGSVFQRILDMISNSDLYKKEFFASSFQHNIYHIQRVIL